MMKNFDIVVAIDSQGGVGFQGSIPWKVKGDMAFFKRLTTLSEEGKKNGVIMGRKTWDSLPASYKPLPDRVNLVLTRSATLDLPEGVCSFSSLDDGVTFSENHTIDRLFVIGGSEIYREAIQSQWCRCLYVTYIEGQYNCDTFFPEIPDRFHLMSESKKICESDITYSFRVYNSVID
ncbi:MAG: dihydrofolate reductase [Candidatus Margulisbacteria bacterium]|nr:dihydrofolate reductase [Candidatus Margulisiibacteriota bacterium]